MSQELIQSLVVDDHGHPSVEAGDTVKVHVRIVEGTRERIQVFQGIVIRSRKGGNEANFTVRRIASHGVGVERTFLLRSPRIEKSKSCVERKFVGHNCTICGIDVVSLLV